MRYHATAEGNLPFTEAEEIEREAEEARNIARLAEEQAAEAARQQAAEAARAELALDTLSKMSYAEIRAHIAGLGLPAPITNTLTKMAVVLKALAER